MSNERKGIMKFRGQDVTIIGDDIQVGEQVPEFTVMTKDWSWIEALASQQGKVRIIGSCLLYTSDAADDAMNV